MASHIYIYISPKWIHREISSSIKTNLENRHCLRLAFISSLAQAAHSSRFFPFWMSSCLPPYQRLRKSPIKVCWKATCCIVACRWEPLGQKQTFFCLYILATWVGSNMSKRLNWLVALEPSYIYICKGLLSPNICCHVFLGTSTEMFLSLLNDLGKQSRKKRVMFLCRYRCPICLIKPQQNWGRFCFGFTLQKSHFSI